jgi:aspartyl-tRNA(Asn)/glutamyl-tRNA(Gln) amidotransferase subunit C
MLEIKDIEKLAKLARIELKEEEKQAYLKDISAILGYVDQIKEVVSKTGEERKAGELRNVMRADEAGDSTMVNAESIIAEFPNKDGNRLKVKKILET